MLRLRVAKALLRLVAMWASYPHVFTNPTITIFCWRGRCHVGCVIIGCRWCRLGCRNSSIRVSYCRLRNSRRGRLSRLCGYSIWLRCCSVHHYYIFSTHCYCVMCNLHDSLPSNKPHASAPADKFYFSEKVGRELVEVSWMSFLRSLAQLSS